MNPQSPVRLLLSAPLSFGPGKAELLEKIDELGSLQGAAAAMEMSYMKAWKFVKTLNSSYREPVVILHRGGKDQGGAELSKTGKEILARYHEAVNAAEKAALPSIKRMRKLLAPDESKSRG